MHTPYLRTLEDKLTTGEATERTHYAALEAFLKGVWDATNGSLTIINEPQRIACGAPDFILSQGQTPIGYVEAKDVGANLDAVERTEQFERYRESLNNLILTDYLTFRWYVAGELRTTARLGRLTSAGDIERVSDKEEEGAQAVVDLLRRFFAWEGPTVSHPNVLAAKMAALARMIRALIAETFRQEGERGSLHAQLEAFRETLTPNLTPDQFADMYAQTITYGLFAARVRAPVGRDFTRESAAWKLPRTNPFLRRLFNKIAGPDLDKRIAWLVDDLARLLARADMGEILRDFGQRTRREDPVVHFYETFLRAYDPAMRQARGVYYTPEPVVSYIVRSLDYLLQTRFRRRSGLADREVHILDPAVGTATFLYFVIRAIHEYMISAGVSGVWNDYVEQHLLPRLFGFELLMAPYTVAHMKLGILLQETGYEFKSDQRLRIYLTNALEEPVARRQTLGFASFITEEANAAAEVKRETPIMVVLGNPPYAISSANQGDYIHNLMDRYKQAVRDEQNIQPLSDDYIKFIRFAHDRIERTGHGIVGMITNHSYLSGLIHRGMREELMKSFDQIYVLNLHGNALMGETTPDGRPDENVFDIRQGVAIALFVKLKDGDADAAVYYADLWGRRKDKYDALLAQDLSTTAWQKLAPQPPHYFFVPKDFDLLSEYEKGWSVPDIFVSHSTGFETGRDSELIAFGSEQLMTLLEDLGDSDISDEEIARKYNIKDTSGWYVSTRRQALIDEGVQEKYLRKISYRPFDQRYTYYHDFLRRAQFENLQHLCEPNIALIAARIIKGEEPKHFFVTEYPTEKIFLSSKTSNNAFIFPLYLYNNTDEERRRSGQSGNAANMVLLEEPTTYETRRPNLSRPFIAAAQQKLGLTFVAEGRGDLRETFGPEDVLHYAYAVFHAPTYRTRYAEFLKIDFPRLPLTSDRALFAALAAKGAELSALHLMTAPQLAQSKVRFPENGSRYVESGHPRYLPPGEPTPGAGDPLTEGRVYINETQYFAPIPPDVWAFEIGGYQVLHKWLKDRKRARRQLSFEDVQHYRRIVVALAETMRLMAEIDALIPHWPLRK